MHKAGSVHILKVSIFFKLSRQPINIVLHNAFIKNQNTKTKREDRVSYQVSN